MLKLLRLMFWTAVIATLALASIPRPPTLLTSDKSQHELAFAVLAILAIVAFPRTSRWLLAAALAALGGAIEIIQLNPALQRQADIMDWFADLSAIALVFALRWGIDWGLRLRAGDGAARLPRD